MSEFFKWLESKDSKKADENPEYRTLEVLWDASRATDVVPPPSEVLWADIRMRMAAAEMERPRVHWFRMFFIQKPYGFSIAAVLVLGLALVLSSRQAGADLFQAERGISRKVVELHDKSNVFLSAGTRLALASGFNHENRNVVLEGEAFFDVKKGDSPFVIQAGPATVRVVGTRFNVSTWEGKTRISVTEGVVEFSTDQDNPDKTVTLHAGESSEIRDGIPVAPVKHQLKDDEPAWLQDRIDYEDVAFATICDQVSRRFDIKINVTDPELAATKVAGSLETKDLDTTMQALVFAIDGHFSKNGDTFTIAP